MVVPPIIFFIKKYPFTWRLPCLPVPCTELHRPLPVYSPQTLYSLTFFVNKFIKKKKKRCPYLYLCFKGVEIQN